MSDAFKTMLCKDPTISDITSDLGYVVKSGAAQTTLQQFPSTAASSSNMIFSVQVPSENIVIGRDILIESDMAFNFEVGSAAVPITLDVLAESNKPPTGYIIGWGRECALNAFPMSQLMNTATSTINNTSVSVNLQDVLPQLLRLNDSRCLYAYNGMTPSLPDQAYYNYENGVGALNNPLGSYNNAGQDVCLVPRGAFPVQLVVEHRVGAGAFAADGSPIAANTIINNSLEQLPYANSDPDILFAPEQYWKVYVKFQVSEPLFLSPFTWSNPEFNAQGLLGINNMAFNFNIDSTLKRIMCDGSGLKSAGVPLVKVVGSGAGTIVDPSGSVLQSGLFNNTNMLLKFLSTQPSDRLETKNVVPYMDFPRYLTNATNNAPIGAKVSTKVTSNNLQLNQLPDYFIICVRKQMASMTIQDASAFLRIKSISVNLNNASGLLSSARAQDLWKMSVKNGSTQSWAEFSGEQWSFGNGPDFTAIDISGTSGSLNTGGSNVPTTGSLLILSPPYDLSLPDYLSSGSLGNFNFQIQLDIENQSSDSVTPEICVICVNSGIFITQQGVSSVYSGLLTREQTLRTKGEPVSDEPSRRIGGGPMSGKLLNKHSLVKMARKVGGAITGAGKGALDGMF